MTRKQDVHWKALFVFRNRSKTLHINSDATEKEVHKLFQSIARARHWRLLRVFRGQY